MLYKFLTWYRDYKLAVIKAKADAVNAPYQAIAEVAKTQSEFMHKWLDGFKVSEIPTSTVLRDEDEWVLEQNRLRDNIGVVESKLFPDLRDLLS